MNIAVAGTGYVGMSISTLLAQHNHVTAVDVIPEKVEKINKRISPIQDDYIEKYLAEKELDLTATLDGASAYKDEANAEWHLLMPDEVRQSLEADYKTYLDLAEAGKNSRARNSSA